jgi:NAD(P)-dependent dehydrogenase (short-subunit alcohol dehydrogenase family)
MGRLDGKVVLISGGARGQGAVEVRLFAREGARVVFGDLLDTEGRQLEAEIRGTGGDVTYLHLDVTREDDWRAAVGAAVNRYGRLDVLVNNAGILLRKRTEDTSAEEWDRVLAVNVTGVFFGTKHALPALRQAGGGSIVNISSIAGLVGSVYGSSAYTATKGAVRLFTKSIAIQHAGENIRCNSIHPGPIDTEMMRDVFGDPAMREERRNPIPLRRIGRAEDVAYGALYLASDEASFVTGAELVIDGGITAQ